MSADDRIVGRRATGGLDMSFVLTRDMARRHGVDLSVALYEGFLTRADFVAMIDRCRACPGTPEDCRDYHEDHAAATVAPPWCANRAILEGLRDLG